MKRILLFVPIFLVLSIVASSISSNSMYKDISNNVLRLHILANSDSAHDQVLKLKVRDEILNESKYIFSECNTIEEAIKAAKENLKNLKRAVDEIIKDNGYSYQSTISLSKEFYSIRKYDTFMLPAGFYNSIKITIGSGEGHNWWCVMYPSVCISGCTEDFEKSLTEEEIREITSNHYIPKFKIAEIYIRIKSKILS